MRNIQEWTKLVQPAAADYQREAQRLATLLAETHRLQHRVLIEHFGQSTQPGYDCASWDGHTLHVWEAKNYSVRETDKAGVVYDLNALYHHRVAANVRQFLKDLPEDDSDRAGIARALQSDEAQWHIRLGPDTDISFAPLDNLGWGSVEARQYSYADMVAAAALLFMEPLQPPALPEAREGNAGDPQRGG